MVLGLTINPFVGAIFGQIASLPYLPGVLSNPAQNVANVIATATNIGTLVPLIGVLTGVLGPVLQIGFTGQEIYDAIQTDDFEAAVNAVISFPSDLANTTLNGNPAIPSGGLLGPYSATDVSGVITALLSLRPVIAGVINPPVLPPAPPPAPPTLSAFTEVNALGKTFTPGEAGDTGIQGGKLLSLNADPEGKVGQQDLNSGPQAIVETKKVSNVDEVTNTGATVSLVSQSGGTSAAGSSSTKANKPGERLRTAFEGTVDRIEKSFDDAVKGFDNALKGLSGRDKSEKSGADAASAGAGASEGASAGS